jgi:indole-3-glycerol phosphate synthase
MSSVLDKILATKREEIAGLAETPSDDAMKRVLAHRRRSLAAALRRGSGEPVRVLAEIKRASPSAGPIRPGADPADIARQYEAGGASAISVLTDKRYFDGDLAFLGACRDAVALPLLRKDFMIDHRQLFEAAEHGADAVLLIVAALPPELLSPLLRVAATLRLDALVEAHTVGEADAALAAGAKLLGVNHRDLHTFAIDMSLTEQIAKRVPSDVVLVAESGIKTRDDVRRMGDAGAHAVLVGESLMRAPSPGAALAELLA